MMPCSAGVNPVTAEVSAVEVVDGTTVVMGPPSIAASVGARWLRSRSCSHPNPSTSSTTTCAASRAESGNHAGSAAVCCGPSRAGMMPRRFAPA